MKRLWTRREIDAPAEVLWQLLIDPREWPRWGPSLRSARLDGATFETGATGTIRTVMGVDVSFEITDHIDGRQWAWKVAGIPATDHRVEPLGPDRCRIGFGVPWAAAPYLAVCDVALRRLDAMATNGRLSR